jgi:hypothetical protein
LFQELYARHGWHPVGEDQGDLLLAEARGSAIRLPDSRNEGDYFFHYCQGKMRKEHHVPTRVSWRWRLKNSRNTFASGSPTHYLATCS